MAVPETDGLTESNPGQRYSAAMAITDQALADRHFKCLVGLCMQAGKTREEAEEIERSNLGYWAGYHDHETRLRVERLFRCQHPFLGKAGDEPMPAEEAFNLGKQPGEMMKEKGSGAIRDWEKSLTDRKIEQAVDRLTKDVSDDVPGDSPPEFA